MILMTWKQVIHAKLPKKHIRKLSIITVQVGLRVSSWLINLESRLQFQVWAAIHRDFSQEIII